MTGNYNEVKGEKLVTRRLLVQEGWDDEDDNYDKTKKRGTSGRWKGRERE